MINISIIIPFLNEELNIQKLVIELNNFCSKTKLNIEVIFVDDGSTDNSLAELVKQEIKSFNAKIIKLSQNYGSHSALRAGIQQASGNYIGFTYADLQDPLDLQLKMYNLIIEENVNIVWGSREKTNNAFIETLFSKLYSRLMKRFVNSKYPINGFDVVFFDEKVKDTLNKNIESNSSIFLQILSLGFKQKTIPYNKSSRKIGKSKWTFSKKIKLFIDSFIAFSYAPIRFVTIIGILLFIFGVCFSIYLILRKIFFNDLDSGWPMLISLITLGFGITNISLGIIAEYLWRTLDATRKRPVFIIDNIIELTENE